MVNCVLTNLHNLINVCGTYVKAGLLAACIGFRPFMNTKFSGRKKENLTETIWLLFLYPLLSDPEHLKTTQGPAYNHLC